MAIAIGVIEFSSIARGVDTTDKMLKAARVDLLKTSTVCPGKYITIVSGRVDDVKSSMRVARQHGAEYVVDTLEIPNIHEQLIPAIVAGTVVEKPEAIGVMEFYSVTGGISAADVAAKAAKIQMLEIRIARGLGGKGFLVFTGEVSSVRSAVKACANALGETGEITSHCVIASPHKDLVKQVLAQ